jgi:hypothetical protein
LSSPKGSSALLYRGGKVTSRSAKHERALHVPTSPWARLGGVIQSGNPKGRLPVQAYETLSDGLKSAA